MVIFSRLELLNQRQLLNQAIFGKSLLERQLAFLLNAVRKMTFDITSSWKMVLNKDRIAILSLTETMSKDANYIIELTKIQPETSIATVKKENTAGLTIPKIELIELKINQNKFEIPVTHSFNIDNTIESFEIYYKEVLKYVEKMINFQRLVKKIKKTRRQLTMLERDLIPELKSNISLIRFTLNQRELDDKIRIMKIAKKISTKKYNS